MKMLLKIGHLKSSYFQTFHKCLCGNLAYNSEKKVSEYDQEIPQSQTADNPMAPRGRATQPSRDTRKTNSAKQPALSSSSNFVK